VQLRLASSPLLQQPRRLHHVVRLLVRDADTEASCDDRDALVAPPRILLGQLTNGYRQVLRYGLRPSPGLLRLLLPSRVPDGPGDAEMAQQMVQPRRRPRPLVRLGDHRAQRFRQLKSPESFFKMRLAIVISPIPWSRSASSAFSRSIVLASSDRAPRPVSASLPPLRNSSRHRYSVCSDIPARRAICTAGSSLLNRRNTIWARCSALNVDFFPISPLLLRNTTSITDL